MNGLPENFFFYEETNSCDIRKHENFVLFSILDMIEI